LIGAGSADNVLVGDGVVNNSVVLNASTGNTILLDVNSVTYASVGATGTTIGETSSTLSVNLDCASTGSLAGNVGTTLVYQYAVQGTANSQALNSNVTQIGYCRTTTNSAVTGLIFSVPTNSVVGGLVTVVGRDVTSGTVGDGFCLQQTVIFRTHSGTTTVADTLGTAMTSYFTSMSGCSVSYVVASNTILIKVTGLSSTTIDWTVQMTQTVV